MLSFTVAVVVLCVTLIVLELLRRRALREKYAFAWLTTISLLIFGAIFHDQVNALSKFLGFEVLSNFVIVLFGLLLLFVVMQMSLELGKLEDQNQTLAEEIALLKEQISNT